MLDGIPALNDRDAEVRPVAPTPRKSPQVVQLLTHLVAWPKDSVRQHAIAIYREQIQPPELIASLRSLILEVVREASAAIAEALGTDPGLLLRFLHPSSGDTEIVGKFGRLRCLHRLWAGPTLLSFQADDVVQLAWQGNESPMIVQASSVSLDGQALDPYSAVALSAGCHLFLTPGASILLRQPPVSALLAAAVAAGVDLGIIFDCGEAIAAQTTAGEISLASNVVRIRVGEMTRKVSLSRSEAAALRILMQSGGKAVSRASLVQELQIKSASGVEQIIMNLRNKLGDGIIGTIHGVGYLLE